MPRIFYDEEIKKSEFDVSNVSDEDLTQLMEKYKEKSQRYSLFLNEEKERTDRKILMIHLEQVKRFHLNKNK